jgi:hypothetical protein
MSRWLKISLRVGGLILGLFLIAWIALAAYVYTHKKEILTAITTQLNEDLSGKLTINRMEPSLIRRFPGISVGLEDVLLRDSLWSVHKHDLLKAKNVYVAINAFSILSGSIKISDIELKNAEIYLLTDSLGVRNTEIFKKKKPSDDKGGISKKISRVHLKDVKLTIDDQQKHKLFKFSIINFKGRINQKIGGWEGNVKTLTQVDFFAFNLKRGSFLKGKLLDLDLDMKYTDKTGLLAIPMQEIMINKDDLIIGGNLNFSSDNTDYLIEILAPSILFKDAKSLLSSHIISKLQPYDVKKPLEVHAYLSGKFKQGGDPLIKVNFKANDNILSTRGETITDCSFTGIYTNEWKKGLPRKDPNSLIAFYNLKGNFYEIPFTADSIQISDLRDPVFTGKFKAGFQLEKLNNIFGGNTFQFTAGTADLNLVYKAPFNQLDTGRRYIYGTVNVDKGAAAYNPRNLLFKDIKMLMNFKGEDLFLENLKVKSGTTSLAMEAVLKNFSNFYYTDPQKILIDWKVKSPNVNLNEFLAFLGKRKQGSNPKGKRFTGNLDKMLEQASMVMEIEVDRLIYKNFQGKDLRSNITLNQSGILINRMSIKQGGGSMDIKGNIDQSGTVNRLNMNSRIINVNVQNLFYAFDNFGQDAITDKNLRGTFFGDASVSGSMLPTGKIVPRSLSGKVSFDIRNGSLVNFEPMYKIGNFAFPNRDFSNITFMNLKNTLSISRDKVTIPPMEIRSSVLNIYLSGVYSFGKGTDIGMLIPLRNPRRDESITDADEKRERSLKGIVLNLRAVDGEDGKVKIRLGKKSDKDSD